MASALIVPAVTVLINPLNVLGSIFASPKSGIIHPTVDTDWKGKMEQYFEYILKKRDIQRNYYTG